jgi:hypothetical protein
MMKELNDIPKQNPFRVPENYFGNLTERVISRTTSAETQSPGKTKVRRLRPFIAVAASVALISLIGYTAFYFAGSARKGSSAGTDLTGKYTSIYLNDIDIATLEENVTVNATEPDLPEITKNEIIDYLISEDINILDIYEQL